MSSLQKKDPNQHFCVLILYLLIFCVSRLQIACDNKNKIRFIIYIISLATSTDPSNASKYISIYILFERQTERERESI